MPESEKVLEDLLEEPGFELNSEGGIDTDRVENRRVKWGISSPSTRVAG